MILSDFNKTGKTASVVARRQLYSDIPLNFLINPITKDISYVTDIDAMKNSVKNLVLTNFHERPFDPSLGSGLTHLLFEPATIFTAIEIQHAIEKVINNHEPRVTALEVTVTDDSDNNRYHISIQFTVTFSEEINEINFFLVRLR